MKISTLIGTLIFLVMCSFMGNLSAHEVERDHETVTPAFSYDIPNPKGKTITSLVVEYKPGAKSKPHRHGSAFVIAYVLSGEIRSQIEGEPAKIYKAGDSWIEAPGAHHTMSENVSDSEPAKLLAIFIADTKEKKLLVYDDEKK